MPERAPWKGFLMLAKILLAAVTLTLALIAMRRFAERAEAARVKVRAARRTQPTRTAVALRQDPRTGVWRED
ncbi:MAG: hypothetical protein U1E46_02515 [Hyphomicrobiales bacterium]